MSLTVKDHAWEPGRRLPGKQTNSCTSHGRNSTSSKTYSLSAVGGLGDTGHEERLKTTTHARPRREQFTPREAAADETDATPGRLPATLSLFLTLL